MRVKRAYIILTVACIIIGLALAIQLKTNSEEKIFYQLPGLERPQTLAARVEEARERNERLQKQIERLRKQLDEAAADPELASLKQKLDEVRALAGLTALKGPGVKVILNDSQETVKPGDNPNMYIIHDEDLLRVINELNAAGAEALAINGRRFVATTEIRCIGPTVLINKSTRLAPPFEIEAIGNPETLYSALKMKNGVVDSLQKLWGIEVEVQKKDQLMLPPYEGGFSFKFAKPAD